LVGLPRRRAIEPTSASAKPKPAAAPTADAVQSNPEPERTTIGVVDVRATANAYAAARIAGTRQP